MRRKLLVSTAFFIAAASLVIADPNRDKAGKDAKFLQQSSLCDQFEIAASRIVLERTDKPDIKSFAQSMIDEHTQHNQSVNELAQKKGITIPDSLEPWQQVKLDFIKTIDSHELGYQYVYCQVGAHQTGILMNRCAAAHLQDSEIKSFAERTAAKMRSHQSRAERLAEDLINGPDRLTSADKSNEP
jgi:putative membrane protein